MAYWQIALLACYGVVLALVVVRHLLLAQALPKLQFLTPQSPRTPDDDAPFVSIMAPAKDEAHGIEACVRSLLAQDYPNFEVLVVDDRSEDETAAIVERLCAEHEKLRLIRIRELPEGWTGKTHALHECQQHAKGDWLLFVDADTRHDPSCLTVALRDCLDHDAELESLLLRLQSDSFWESVVQPFAGICLMAFFPLLKINDPAEMEMGFANGQFILIGRRAYDAIGGHEAVRDKFVEDIHLGRRARRMGLGLRVAFGRDIASVRMYASLAEMFRGWSRILYSAVDHQPRKLYGLMIAIGVFSLLSYAILIGGGAALLAGFYTPFLATLFAMGAVHQVLQTTLMARLYRLAGSKLRYLAFRPLAVLIVLYILARTVRMCHTHEVQWRGTAYGKELQTAAEKPDR